MAGFGSDFYGSQAPEKRAPKKKRKPRKKEIAGPYRSQSSNPKIRSEATESEHRKVLTPEGRRATQRKLKRVRRKSAQILREADLPGVEDTPQYEVLKGRTEGRYPSTELKKKHPRAYKKAFEAAEDYHDVYEGLKEDPLAELAISTVATAGLGAAAKGAGALAKSTLASRAGSQLSSAGTTAAEQVAEKGAKALLKKAGKAVKAAPKKKAARIKSAPKRAAKRVKETPQRVRTAPTRAKKAASTPEGRRAAAKGTGRRVAQHPFASFGGSGVLANQSGADIPGLKEAGAFLEGHLQADPWQSAKTTARAIPGIVTGPAALVGSAASSAIHGTTKPLEEEASKQFEGLLEQGGKLLSGDPETVRKAVEDEVGYSFVAPAPAISRFGKTRVYKKGRGAVRGKVARKRQATRAKRRGEIRAYQEGKGPKPKKDIRHAVIDRETGEEFILRRTGKRITNRRARRSTADRIPAWKAKGEREGISASREVVKEVRKSRLSKGDHNIADTVGTVAQYGISRDAKVAARQLDEIEASILAKELDPDEVSVHTINDLRNIQWLRDHPKAFTDKHFWKAVDAYKRQSKEIETSGRKLDLALGDVYGIARPEERLEAGVTLPGRTESTVRRVSEPFDPETRKATAKAIVRRQRKVARRSQRVAGRAARRKAQVSAYTPDVQSISSRDWYHGTGARGLSPDNLEALGTDPMNLFGQGVYLTSNPGIARGYSRVKKGPGRDPTVYKVTVKPNSVLDLEGVADPRFTNALAEVAASIERTQGESVITDRLGTALSKGSASNAQIYGAFRAAVADFARDYGWSRNDLFDPMQELNGRLRAEGWDALTHRGGQRTGHRQHQVVIVLDPRDLAGTGARNPITAFADRREGSPQPPTPLPLSQVPRRSRERTVVEQRPRKVQAPFYKQSETVQRKQAELSELRTDARRYREAMEKATPEERQKYSYLADTMAAKASTLSRELKDARLGYKQATKDYAKEVAATRREKGFEPSAYVKDTRPGGEVGVSSAYTARSAQSQRMADVAQTYRGQVFNRRFEDVVDQSIMAPRMKQAMHDATSEWVDTWKTPVGGRDYVTSDEIQRAVNRGELDPSQFEAFDAQHFKQAILDPNKTIDDVGNEVSGSIRSLKGEILGRANDPGKKYIVVPKEASREFVHQFEPPKGGMKIVGDANRFVTRVILGYSPAWALSQIIAEGIPAAVSIGANPLRWARVAKYMMRENKRLNRKDKAAIDAMAGESPGVTPHPQVSFKPNTNKLASRFFRLSNRNPLGRALLKAATGEALSVFDRYKGGKYRKAVAAAKADREMNNFVTSLGGLMKGQRSIVEAIKGKSLDDQMAYLAKHPAEMAKLEGYLNNVMGNWRALTRHEAKFAPFIAFYPFVRYSLRWTFWSFPKEHPIKAQILYFLSQQNAEELEKIIGGPPENPVDYTFPVFTNSEDEDSVMPGGQRFAPGMNALTTAIGKGRIETTASALNPALGLLYTGISGNDPFTGEKAADSLAEHGLLALNQLLSLPAPLRATIPGVGKSARDLATEALGDEPPSDISKAFKGMDPNREARSFLNPLAPQTPGRYKDSVTLSRSLEESGWDVEDDWDLLNKAVLDARKGDRRLERELIRKRESSDKASDEISRLVREYVSDPEKLPEFKDRDWKTLNRIRGEMVVPYTPPSKESKNPYLDALDTSKKGNVYLEALENKSGGNAYLEALK